MKKLFIAVLAAVLGAVTAPVQAQNVQFHGNVINGHWYQNNDNREWTTWLIGMYNFTDQKKTWTYEIIEDRKSVV